MIKFLLPLIVSCNTFAFENIKKDEVGIAYYIPFYISFMKNIDSNDFENTSFCKSMINKDEFLKNLLPTNKLHNNDTRAKIIFNDNTYIIDSVGIVSNHKENFELKSKNNLEKSLTPILYCNN